MAELLLAPVIEKLIDLVYLYLKDQVRWQRGLKKELEKLLNILPKIQAVVSACSQVEIKDPALEIWYWQLRDAIDEADDVLDEIEYRKLQKQASKIKKTGKVRSLMKSVKKRFVKFCKRALKIDSYLKRLEAAVQKLNEISCWVSIFLYLVENRREEQQQQQLQLLRTRETGAMLGNNFFGRSNEITRVKEWLRNSYETQSTDTSDLYRNISLLSVVGHGGMGKSTLLQEVYNHVSLIKDGATKEFESFDVKMWACVSRNFDAQMVIKNILKSLNKKVPDGEPLDSLQRSLQSEVTSKRFILVLDDIWEEGEAKWDKVLAPLQYGSLGSKILITTRMHSSVSMFAPMIKKVNEKVLLASMEKDELAKLFKKHAFAGENNPDDEFISIAEKMVEKLLGCPLAAKLIGNTLNSHMDKSFWTNVLNTNIGNIKPIKSGQNELLAILKLNYMHLPNSLQNCFSFCCIFPQGYEFDRDDLVRMWIALGYIQSSNIQGDTLENAGRRYFDFLAQRSFFDEICNHDEKVCYKIHDLLRELTKSISAQEILSVVSDEILTEIPKTIRHLSIDTRNPEETFKQMEKFKYLRSLFLSFKTSDKLTDLLSEIFKSFKSIRLLVISVPYGLEIEIPEGIGCLIHLRYLKADGVRVSKLSRSITHLYHLQFVISKMPQNLRMVKTDTEELSANPNSELLIDELVIIDPSSLLTEPLRSINYLRFLTIENNDDLISFPSETELWFLQHSSTLLVLKFHNLGRLQSLPSFLSTFSSLQTLNLKNIPLLILLPDLPSSLISLELEELQSLQCLPSSLSAISSLQTLKLRKIPILKSFPDLPSSLIYLELEELQSLQCVPPSLSAIYSLQTLKLRKIPILKSFPDLPSSLIYLELEELESLQYLPSSLSAIFSLDTLKLKNIPLIKSLPDLPSSLNFLYLDDLRNLDCLPSCLPTSLQSLTIIKVPRLLEMPDIPVSLYYLLIQDCGGQLMERYPNFRRQSQREANE